MSERCELCLVERFVAQPFVEVLDERIPRWFAQRDVVPFEVAVLRPLQNGHAGQLRAVVSDDRQWFAAPGDDGMEFTANTHAGYPPSSRR